MELTIDVPTEVYKRILIHNNTSLYTLLEDYIKKLDAAAQPKKQQEKNVPRRARNKFMEDPDVRALCSFMEVLPEEMVGCKTEEDVVRKLRQNQKKAIIYMREWPKLEIAFRRYNPSIRSTTCTQPQEVLFENFGALLTCLEAGVAAPPSEGEE